MVRFFRKYKYYIVKILLLALIIVLRAMSHSYASVNLTNFEEINYNGDKYDFVDNIVLNYFGLSLDDIPKRQGDLNNWNQFFNDLLGSSYEYMYITNDREYTTIWLTNNIDFQSPNIIREYTIYKFRVDDYILYYGVSPNVTRTITGNQEGTIVNKYLKTDLYYDSVYNSYKPVFTPSLEFELATHYSITDYKGYGQTNAFKYTYNNNRWLLGICSNLEVFDEVVFKMIDLTSNRNIATAFKNGSVSNMRLVGNNLQIDGYILYQNQPYRLSYDAYLNGEVVDSFYYNVVFMDVNAVISNGVVSNYGSGDGYNVQNSTNDITSIITDDSEVDEITNSYLSGDYESIAYDFGFSPIDNPYTTFILTLVDKMYDALTERKNVILDERYETFHLHLESDDFNYPNNNLKQFVRLMLIFIYLYGNYKFFNHLITLLETAQIEKLTQELGTDEFYDTDYM